MASTHRSESTRQRFATIVADPPWEYEGFASAPGNPKRLNPTKKVALPYDAMSVDAIKSIDVGAVAVADCRLFMWTTNRYLPTSFDVLAAWGFKYRQALVWHKTGNPSPFGGAVAPIHAEFLLVASRGSPTVGERLASSVVAANKLRDGHSQKPEVFLDLVEQVSPGPYLEIFARRARFGWEYAGDGSLGTVEIPGLRAPGAEEAAA